MEMNKINRLLIGASVGGLLCLSCASYAGVTVINNLKTNVTVKLGYLSSGLATKQYLKVCDGPSTLAYQGKVTFKATTPVACSGAAKDNALILAFKMNYQSQAFQGNCHGLSDNATITISADSSSQLGISITTTQGSCSS